MQTVSVGICAHNEEATIGRLLGQVLDADVPVEEVIVVVAGDDATADIVERFREHDDRVDVVREDERRGQSAAQNEILQRADGDLIMLVDGDGWLGEDALEIVYENAGPHTIVYGRETPVTPSTYTGDVIETFWAIHDRLSRRSPKFTTQLACIPAGLIERIPPEVVIDDEYIGRHAQRAGYTVVYCPEAQKFHNIKGDAKSFIRHRRKNWAGMIQLRRGGGVGPMQSDTSKLRAFADQLVRSGSGDVLPLLTVACIEAYSYLGAQIDIRVLDDPPYIWER